LLGSLRSWGDFYDGAANCCAFTDLHCASVCAGSTAKRGQVEGGCTKIGQHDKTKARVYCQINALDEQIGEADRKNDKKKAEALSKRVTELEKKLGPEYLALAVDLNNVNTNSPVGQEIDSMLASLDDSCVE
jgi:hypothetical protein